MLTTVLECLAVWFVISVPFSLFLGAFLARREAALREALPHRQNETLPVVRPVLKRYEAVK